MRRTRFHDVPSRESRVFPVPVFRGSPWSRRAGFWDTGSRDSTNRVDVQSWLDHPTLGRTSPGLTYWARNCPFSPETTGKSRPRRHPPSSLIFCSKRLPEPDRSFSPSFMHECRRPFGCLDFPLGPLPVPTGNVRDPWKDGSSLQVCGGRISSLDQVYEVRR